MTHKQAQLFSAIALAALGVTAGAPSYGELSEEELAKLAQNPIANLISVPFQYNANLNYGPEKDTQSILNIEPVVPFETGQGLEFDHAHDRSGDLTAGPDAR